MMEPAGTLMSAFNVSTPAPVVICPPRSVSVDATVRFWFARSSQPEAVVVIGPAIWPDVSIRTMSASTPPLALPTVRPAGTEMAGGTRPSASVPSLMVVRPV